MHIALLFIGALSAIAGMAMLAYGSANYAATIGSTLIVSGTTALVGGAIVVGLAAVVSRIRRLAEALDRQPLPRIAGERFDIGRFAPKDSAMLAPVPAPPPSADQIEQQPATFEAPEAAAASPLPDTHQGGDAQLLAHPEEPVVEELATEPQAGTDLSRQAEPKSPEDWPAVRPRDAVPPEVRPGRLDPIEGAEAAVLEPRQQRYQPLVPPARPSAIPAAAAEETAVPPTQAIILKSGVLDGMAYTLYSDGSIEAELREGTMRFRSIPELRAYLFEHAR